MKIKNIIILIIIALLLGTTQVFGGAKPILLTGETNAKTEESKTMSLRIEAEKIIGAVSGKIEVNDKIAKVTVNAKNGWSVTYNEKTGTFMSYKAEGSDSEDIMDIEYTTGNEEGKGTIIVKEINVTLVENYTELTIENIVKEITIENGSVDPAPPTLSSNNNLEYIKIDGTPINDFNKETLEYRLAAVENNKSSIEIEAKAEDTKAVVEGTGTKELKEGDNTFEIKVTAEDGKTKMYKINVERKAAKDDDGTADKDYNYAGVGDFLIIGVIITTFAMVLYKKNQKYKGI